MKAHAKKQIDFIRIYYLEGFLSISSFCRSCRTRCDFPFAGIYSKYANRLWAFFSSQKQGSPLKDAPLTQSSLSLALCSVITFWQWKSSHLPPSLSPPVSLPPPPQAAATGSVMICDLLDTITHTQKYQAPLLSWAKCPSPRSGAHHSFRILDDVAMLSFLPSAFCCLCLPAFPARGSFLPCCL